MSSPPPEAGVVDLLKRLRSHIYKRSRSNLRNVVPIYERLLRPCAQEDDSAQHRLLEIRAKLLACGGDADVADAVDRMDQVVERCLELSEQEKKQRIVSIVTSPVPIEEMMRLLTALAGGQDGETFVLEDPMRLTTEGSRHTPFISANKRIGDRICMNDVGLLQRSRTLFDKMPVPLEEKKFYSSELFSEIGNGLLPQHASLWCPDTSMASSDVGFPSMLPYKANQFMGSAFGPELFQSSGTPKPHDVIPLVDTVAAVKSLTGRESAKRTLIKDEVFFYDATQEVRCNDGGLKQLLERDNDESSALTENSSWDSDSSVDLTGRWIAQTYAWEDLGNRTGLPSSYYRPSVQESGFSFQDVAIPVEFACDNHHGERPLEVHGADLIEDSMRVLGGVESTMFRRDITSATFRLPEKRKLKLRNATVSVTTSVLETFRKAGTLLLRLELLATYFSQDPARGGKTLQAMGNALLVYVSLHRARIEAITKECTEPWSDEMDDEDGNISVTKLVCKTRKVCRVLDVIGHVFGCDKVTFWPLIQKGKFPRGIALLDHLYHHVHSLRAEDAMGDMQELMTWFLVKSCSPLLVVLSELMASGSVGDATDPFDEFEVTNWSRSLLGKAATGGGDGLFCEQSSTSIVATEMMPVFLKKTASHIIHVSQIQALLRKMDAIPASHPLVNTPPLVLLGNGDIAVKHIEEWQSSLAGITASTLDVEHEAFNVGENMSTRRSANHGEDARLGLATAKQISQRKQCEMLDQQVFDEQQRNLQLAQEEEANDRVERTRTRGEDQEAIGREVLLNRYSKLISSAEARHDYMKWRWDRALRLSTAKDQLRRLHADDIIMWTSAQENLRNTSIVEEMEASSIFISDESASATEEVMPNTVSDVPVDDLDTTFSQEKSHFSRVAGMPSTPPSSLTWRATVKLSKEVGRRSSAVLGAPTLSDPAGCKSTVRVLNVPGGGGDEMYIALYGGSPGALTSPKTKSVEDKFDALASRRMSDSEMAYTSMIVDHNESPDSALSGESLPKISGEVYSNDIVMTDADEERANEQNDPSDTIVLVDSNRVAPDSAERGSSRMYLPDVHPFFAGIITDGDADVVRRALKEMTSAPEGFTPFASIVNYCVEVPVRLISHKLEGVAVAWFRTSLKVTEHLRWLWKLMLMSEGLCMDIFVRDFLRGLNSATRVNWGLEDRLTSALSLAMIEASVDADEITQRFHYKTTAALSEVLGSLMMTPAVPNLLSEMELVYDVQWPLGLIITSHMLDLYKQVHRFLLYVRLTSVEMREAWSILRSIRQRGELPLSLQRLCGDVVYKTQAFLGVLSATFALKVLDMWSDFERALQKATTLVELRRCHEEYVAVAVRYCFLDTAASKIHFAVTSTLAAAWRVTSFVRDLGRQVTGRKVDGSRLQSVCSDYNDEIQALVSRLHSSHGADRETRELCESMLLGLNFNEYYCTDDLAAANEVMGE